MKVAMLLVFVFCFAACGDDDDDSNNANNTNQNNTTQNNTNQNNTNQNNTNQNNSNNSDDLFVACGLACDTLIGNRCVGYESGDFEDKPHCVASCQVVHTVTSATCTGAAADCSEAGDCL